MHLYLYLHPRLHLHMYLFMLTHIYIYTYMCICVCVCVLCGAGAPNTGAGSCPLPARFWGFRDVFWQARGEFLESRFRTHTRAPPDPTAQGPPPSIVSKTLPRLRRPPGFKVPGSAGALISGTRTSSGHGVPGRVRLFRTPAPTKEGGSAGM